MLLLVMLLGFSLNIPNFIWHGFHYPNSLPARQSFLYIILLLAMCYEAYKNIRANTGAQLAGSFWGAALFIFLCEAIIVEEDFSFQTYYLTLLFVGLYALLLYYHKNRKAWGPTLAILAVTVISIEASVNTAVPSVSTVSRTAYLENQPSYRALAKAVEEEDSSLFRIEKDTRKTKNDAALAGYRSASLFSSTANAHLSDLYKALGLEGNTTPTALPGPRPWPPPFWGSSTPCLLKPWTVIFTRPTAPTGTSPSMKNRYYLPIGFMLPQSVSEYWEPDSLNPWKTRIPSRPPWERAPCSPPFRAEAPPSASLH